MQLNVLLDDVALIASEDSVVINSNAKAVRAMLVCRQKGLIKLSAQ